MNADFDALASMVAAKKLYPTAEMVFAGSQEKTIRNYLAQDFLNIYKFKRIKHIDLEHVKRLIIVDTRQAKRIGRLSECLENPGIEIYIYDHHPDSEDDIKGGMEVIEAVGSTSTIFTKLFQEKEISLTQDEATLLALGIYEDTGTFLHTTTTPEDMQASAWLLSCGANLDIITQFISHDLSTEQVGLLGDLLKNATTYTIQSINIVIAKLTLPEYVDNFAVIIQRLMILENLDVIFGLLSMGERTYLIARSRIPEVNVGLIARDFGGGGHASAASATVKDMTIFEGEEKLVNLLHKYIRPKAIAQEIMSYPVIAVTADISINEANNLLTRYNITVLPVVGKQDETQNNNGPTNVLGLISRLVVEKAIFFGMGNLPVSSYMTTDVITLPVSSTLADIKEVIIENRQRLLPLTQNGVVKGVITRTDLLNMLVNDPARLPKNLLHEDKHPSIIRTRNLSNIMTKNLNRAIMRILQDVGEVAEQLKYQAYVVGGFVRDLLLQIENHDIDIVIEGDGIKFAKELALRKNAEFRPHIKFGTATIILPDNMRIDVATARLEYYKYPAAMPTVELSSIKLDLYRRDFTINAMAIHLNPDRFGTLVDFFSSQNDLRDRRIRVLHNLSFVEDPTRIFRAIRFEQRLDFKITKHVEKLIKNGVQMNLFDRFSAPRFLGELKLILSEDNPIPTLRRFSDFNLFQFLWPDLEPNLKMDRRFIHILTQASKAISWFKLLYLKERFEPWIVYLLCIMSRSGIKELNNFCLRFELIQKTQKKLFHEKTSAENIAANMLRRPHMKPSEIYWLLQDLNIEGLLYLFAIARKKFIQKAVSQFVTNLRNTQPLITGQNLLDEGYKPGPLFRTMLNHLIEAQLNGAVNSKSQAIQFLKSRYRLSGPARREGKGKKQVVKDVDK